LYDDQLSGNDDYGDHFEPRSPYSLTADMAEGIANSTHFYIRYGTAKQRLRVLAANERMPVVTKWQKMMEVFLRTQLHVISGLGYNPDETGLQQYAQDLAKCMQGLEPTVHEALAETRRGTWRRLVATCFNIRDLGDIPVFSVVQARNFMHKIASKMIEPEVLLHVQNETAKIKRTFNIC
jgi:hypothetical protein